MQKTVSFLLLFCFTLNFFSQEKDSVSELKKTISLKLDSFEIRITENKRWTDTSYYVHYSIFNNSSDTVLFTTNSCPSYNTYLLSICDTNYTFNKDVFCSFNAITIHTMLPNNSISLNENILTNYFKVCKNLGIVKFKIPVVADSNLQFRINGFDSNKKEFIYQGKTIFVQKKILKFKKRKWFRRKFKSS